MQETNKTCDRLIQEFAEDYMEKLFYFCLKKTGKRVEAEDLTQDVAFQIIAALNKGTKPVNFSAWVWQIARNRYALWAKKKHDRNESVTGSEIGDYEIEDERENILEGKIRTEQMALLRRELAFIKRDYRDIVVAYYIERKNVLVIRNDDLFRIHQLFQNHGNFGSLVRNFADLYESVEEIFKKYSHPVLHQHIAYNIRMELYAARMMAVHDLVEENVLKLPEDPSKSSLGMYIILK